MPELGRRRVRFSSGACDADALGVVSLTGTEALARLYRFEIELASSEADLDLKAVLREPARLDFMQTVHLGGGGVGQTTVPVHGVLASITQGERGLDKLTHYRVVLVPRLWRASLARRTRIFMKQSIPQIIEHVLKDTGLGARDDKGNAGDCGFVLSGTYAQEEYLVQYGETDLDFLQRLCEQEGIFYRFDQHADGDKVVFGDATSAYAPLPGRAQVPYRLPEAQRTGESDEHFEATRFEGTMVPVPAEVALKDYNWRTPDLDLAVKQKTGADPAFGTWYEYGEHFKDPEEGRRYATLRAEDWKSRQTVFTGQSDVKSMRAGFTFDLENHPRSGWNRGYLLTGVRHEASQEMENVSGKSGAHYRNTFTAIPSDVVFRPERLTPWPVVEGTLNARVDAEGDGEYAEIDEYGRYKVTIPFDLSGAKDGKASRFIRMSQPYSGEDMGMHFPLHKGTEVVIIHTNGDPDRPIIAAAIPDAQKRSMVTGQNQTQSKIKTGGGNEVTLEDQDGQQAIKMYSPRGRTNMNIGRIKNPRG